MKSKRTQIVGLDLLRVFAAGLVMLFHFCTWTWQDNAPGKIPAAFDLLQPVSSRGWVGVQIFFVISGFVISYSAEGMSAGRFVRHRLERLLPAAFVCASLTAMVLLAFSSERGLGMRWLRSVIFWPSGPWIDGSYWTLPIEVCFYALVALVLAVRRGRFLPPAMMVLGIVSAVCDLVLVLRPAFIGREALLALGRCWFPPFACLLPVYGVFFSLGAFLYLLLCRGLTSQRLLGVAIAGIGCVAEVLWHARGLIFADPPIPGGWGSVAIWAIAIAFLVVSVQFNSAILAHMGQRSIRLVRLAGLVTYPLYLLHSVLGEWLLRGLHRRIGDLTALLCVMAGVVSLALLVATQIEPRLRELLKRSLAPPKMTRPTRAA